MNVKTIYLSGPMTGIKEYNHPAFQVEAERLRDLGYDVVSPAELNPDGSLSWHDCIKIDIKALVDCDAIALLEGWQKSQGALLEIDIAHRVKIEILIAKDIVTPYQVSVCTKCGCDDLHACEKGCYWIHVNRNAGKGLCSQCVDIF